MLYCSIITNYYYYYNREFIAYCLGYGESVEYNLFTFQHLLHNVTHDVF